MFRAACEALDVPVRAWVIEKLVGVWNKNKLLAAPYPETLEVLQQLKANGIKIAIVSNTPKLSVDGVLEKFGFDRLFDAVCFSYDVGFLKTDPGLFDAAMEKLGVAKDEVVMVGDSLETDIVGAEKAGVTPVLIDRRNSREYKNRIVSLKEIDKFL
jgi:HAD superfamily hydrolase (TIGR01662 family)